MSASENQKNLLNFQFEMAVQLLDYHLNGLEDQECLWKPTKNSLHVHKRDGLWVADWPETESYEIGPPSIAWTMWHIMYWWSMALDHNFGDGKLTKDDVLWPGSVDSALNKINELKSAWKAAIDSLNDEQLNSIELTKWPFDGLPFFQVAGWLNMELMKNASEIGSVRFLYAARKHVSP